MGDDFYLFADDQFAVGMNVTILTSPLTHGRPRRTLRRLAPKVHNSCPTPVFDESGEIVIDPGGPGDDAEVGNLIRRSQPLRSCKQPKATRPDMSDTGTQVNKRLVRKPYCRRRHTKVLKESKESNVGDVGKASQLEEVYSSVLCTPDYNGHPGKSARNVLVQTGRIRGANTNRPSLKTNKCCHKTRHVLANSSATPQSLKAQVAKKWVIVEPGASNKTVHVKAKSAKKFTKVIAEAAEKIRVEATKNCVKISPKEGKPLVNVKSATTTQIYNAETPNQLEKGIAKAQGNTATGSARASSEASKHPNLRLKMVVQKGAEEKHERSQTPRPTPKHRTGTEETPTVALVDPDLGVCHVLHFPKEVYFPRATTGRRLRKVSIHSTLSSAPTGVCAPFTSKGIGVPSTSKGIGVQSTSKAASAPSTPKGSSAPSTPKGISAPSTSNGISAPSTSKATSAPSTPKGISAPSTSKGISVPSTSKGVSAPSTPKGVSAPSTSKATSAPSTPKGISAPSTSMGISTPSTPKGVSAPSTPKGISAPSPPKGVSAPSTPKGVSSPSISKGFAILSTSKAPRALPSAAKVDTPSKTASSVVRSGPSYLTTSGQRTVGVRLVASLEHSVVTNNTTDDCVGKKRPKGRPKMTDAEKSGCSPRKKKRPEKSFKCPVCAHQEDYIALIIRHTGIEHPGVADYLRSKEDSPYDPHWDHLPRILNGVIVAEKTDDLNRQARMATLETQTIALGDDANYEETVINIMRILKEAVRQGIHMQVPNRAKKVVVEKVASKKTARRHLKLAPAPTSRAILADKMCRSEGGINIFPISSCNFAKYEDLVDPEVSSSYVTRGPSQETIDKRMQVQKSASPSMNEFVEAPSSRKESASASVMQFIDELSSVMAGQYTEPDNWQAAMTTTATTSGTDQRSSTADAKKIDKVGMKANSSCASYMEEAVNDCLESPRSLSSAYFSASGSYEPIQTRMPERYTLDDFLIDNGDLAWDLPSSGLASDELYPASTSWTYTEDEDPDAADFSEASIPTNLNPGEVGYQNSMLEAELSPFVSIGQLPRAAQNDTSSDDDVGQATTTGKIQSDRAASDGITAEQGGDSEYVVHGAATQVNGQYQRVWEFKLTVERHCKETDSNQVKEAEDDLSETSIEKVARYEDEVARVDHREQPSGLGQDDIMLTGGAHCELDIIAMYDLDTGVLSAQLDGGSTQR